MFVAMLLPPKISQLRLYLKMLQPKERIMMGLSCVHVRLQPFERSQVNLLGLVHRLQPLLERSNQGSSLLYQIISEFNTPTLFFQPLNIMK